VNAARPAFDEPAALADDPSSYRSKTIATWLAFLGGSIGLQRFYLFGFRDVWGWLTAVPTLAGVIGVQRAVEYGQDDKLAWVLVPWLGLTLAGSMLTAIVYGLTPDDRWNDRFNRRATPHHTTWITILGVAAALFVGAAVLMATIAFVSQRYFELRAEDTSATTR